MARPRDPTALKVAKGKSNMTKQEISEGMSREIYAAEGEIVPPHWMKGTARSHFVKCAEYMNALNKKAKVNIYGSIDVEALTLMSMSYMKSNEYLVEEQKAKKAGDPKGAEAAQNKRMREDRSYREFMKLLKLDPGNRVNVAANGGGDDDANDELSDI